MKNSRTKDVQGRHRDTRMTQKGQVTIPQPIREFLGLQPQDRVRFEVVDGRVVITPAPSSIQRHFATIPAPSPSPTWQSERDAFQETLGDETMTDRSE